MIPLAKPDFSGAEFHNVVDCLQSGWVSKGEFLDQFEKQFAKWCGCRYGVAVMNGTVALHLALEALGIGEGDEVIIPNLTYIATANAVSYTGAKVVLCDVNRDTWTINPVLLKQKITGKTKAVIPVHLYGNPCHMKIINTLAKKYKFYVIEDAAQAHGAMIGKKKVGSFGDIGCFSFFGNKIITTGEGGMCVTNNKKLADKMKLLRNHAIDYGKGYWHSCVGFNYRMTNVQAAIGLAQLERIEEFINQRHNIEIVYNSNFRDEKEITLQQERPGTTKINWLYTILIKDRDKIMKKLKKAGIDSRPMFHPLNKLPPYKTKEEYPISERISKLGLSLPTYYDMQVDEIWTKIGKTILDSVKNKDRC